MNTQFVDLFDRDKYGFNYWAIIFLFIGSAAAWVLVSGWHFAIGDYRMSTPWGQFLLGMMAHWFVFAVLTIGLCHFLQKDLLLPITVGIGIVICRILSGFLGINESAEISFIQMLLAFLWPFLTLGGVVYAYRKFDNKIGAIILGFVAGQLIALIISFLANDTSTPIMIMLMNIVMNAGQTMFDAFITAVFLYAGIAFHFKKQGTGFDEFGFRQSAGVGEAEQGRAQLGKIRSPLTTMLLAAVTLNIYIFGWIYRVYSEIQTRDPNATKITPGQAVGFLFIPLFNFYWVLRLFADLPRAIGQLQQQDPPAGKTPNSWLITGLLIASIIAGIAGFAMEQRVISMTLNPLFLWWGVLLAQSSLNSHWRLHQGV